MKLSKIIKTTFLTTAIFMGVSTSVMAGSYTVKSGDTMFIIAQSHGVTLDALVDANPQIKDVNVIEIGDVLNLPGSGKAMASGEAMACEPTAAYKNAVAEATAALDKAKSVGGEWRDSRWKKSSFVKYTGKDGKTVKSSFMGAAAAAAENCDFTSAMKYLETAKFQGEMGYQQAMEQKSAGPKL